MPEYKVESLKTVGTPVAEVEAWLNEKAEAGLRLVATAPGQGPWIVYYFERVPVQAEEEDGE